MMKRVEHHRLKPSSPFYAMLREFCHRSKNLYNHGNFLIRQTFIDDGKWLRYGEVDRLLKADADYPDYREMPTAQTAQQTLRILDKNWTSFFAAIKDWKAHPEKYKGRPKLPKYKPKDGYFPLVLTNQNCKLKDGVIRFPRVFQGFTVKAIFSSQPDAVFKQARIIPHGGEIDLELVYEIPEVEEKENNGRYAAIDIGVDNLAALAWNTGERPVLLKGTPLKSVNQYYNKQMAKRRSICERMNGRHSSKRIARLTVKRNLVTDYGGCMAPMNAYLTGIGLDTLALRLDRITSTAQQLAEHFAARGVAVNYPGLASSPYHEVAKKQFGNRYGAMLTLRLGTKEKAFDFINHLHYALNVSNIGDARTLVLHPAKTIFVHASEEEKAAAGVTDDLVRINVGLEDPEDLLEDFQQALQQI